MMNTKLSVLALVSAVLLYQPQAGAQSATAAPDFPTKPIRIIVPFPPGGGTDIVARLLAPNLAQALGQSVVIENRAGAGGTIGSEVGARAEPDGYTLSFATSSTHGVAPGLYAKLGYRPVEDFEHVALVATTPFMLAVKKSLPVSSVQELIALAKKSPGKLNFASAGVGSSNQLTMEMFKMMTGVDVVHVPYKGSGPALADLAGGQVEMVINDMASLQPFLKSGQVKPIAVTSLTRSALMPDLPTIDQSGVPGYEALAWYGLLAPRGTPQAIVTRLNGAVVEALRNPEVSRRLADQGFEVRGDGPPLFREFVRAEVKKWGEVIKASGAKAE